MNTTTLLLLLACLSGQASPQTELPRAAAQRLDGKGEIDRLARVGPALLRGGQPSELGLDMLVELGIKTVIDLRTSKTGAAEEREACAARGLEYLWLPMKPSDAPTTSFIKTLLETITSEDSSPTFVHCRHGKDRTGLVIASYRMVIEDWPLEMALKEMDAFDFNKWWWRDMRRFVKSVPEQRDSLRP